MCSLPLTDSCLWTELQCVSAWITSPHQQPVFIQNRLAIIRQESAVTYRYVITSENPADLPSRGTSAQQLQHNDLWWHGPTWLTLCPDEWPTWNVPPCDLQTITESSTPSVIFETKLDHVSANHPGQHDISTLFTIEIQRFSSLSRLLCVTAWIRRFLNNICMINEKRYGPFRADELAGA